MLAFRLLRSSSSIFSYPSLHRVAPSTARTLAVWSTHIRTYAKATEITMPALSPTMEEGVIVEWTKKEGDSFKAGDVLFRLQTDKSVLDVEAPDDGVLAKIVVKANNPPLAINSVVGYIANKGDDLSKLEYPAAKPAKGGSQSQKQETPKQEQKEQKQEKQEKQDQKQTQQPQQQKQQEKPQAQPKQDHKEEHKEDAHHSSEFMFPSVRRLLTENHLELSQVKATGPQGRVVKADVLNAIKNKGDLPPPSKSESVDSSSKQQASPKPATKPQTSTQSFEDIPNSNIRTVIAKRLTESKTKTPHYYTTAECNIDQLLAMRARLNNEQKVKLSVNDFILKAVALTLRDLPAANAIWNNGSIRQLKDVDVSVAVATDKGLITPIIKSTDKKGLATIATELKDLAARARTGSLKPQEFQGGSFSVSNLGMYGISHFSAVINPPQAGILAVGAGRQEIRLKSSLGSSKIDLDSLPPSPSSAPTPSPRSPPSSSPTPSPPSPSPSPSPPPPSNAHGKVVVNVVDVTLSCDNRVIDEALAGQFLERFQKYMSTPEMLVL